MTGTSGNSLYSRLRALLRGAGLSLRDLQARLEIAGLTYSYDALVSWGRSGRGLPREPALLLAIARVLLTSAQPGHPHDPVPVLAFLQDAGLPPAQLENLANLLPPEMLQAARAAYTNTGVAAWEELSLPAEPPRNPAALPPGSRPPPFTPNPLFCGRETLLRQLATALGTGNAVVLTGIGGMGKTQLAAEFAFRYGRFFPGGVFWLRSNDLDAIPAEVAACGGNDCMALHPRFDELPPEVQLRMVQAAWGIPTPRLVILDNVEDVAAVLAARPPVGGCVMLVTSRLSRWPASVGLSNVAVPPLERRHSVALLRALLQGAGASAGELEALAALLGDLPLALHLAGSTLSQELHSHPESLSSLIQSLRTPAPTWPDALAATPTPTEHYDGVDGAFDHTLARLDPTEPTDRVARELLAAAACLAAGALIPRELLLRCIIPAPPEDLSAPPPPLPPIPPQLRRAYERLLTLGLLEPGAGDSVRIHQLVARRALAMNEVSITWAVTAERLMRMAHFYDSDPVNQRMLLPHLRAMARMALAGGEPQAGRLLRWIGWTEVLLGRYAQARRTLNHALEVLGSSCEPTHPDLREAVCCLALAYQYDARFREGWPLWERYIATERMLLAPDDPAYGLALTNAGLFFALAGAPNRAAPLLRESLRRRLALYGWHNEDTARSLRNLTWLAVCAGRYRQAIRCARATLDLIETFDPPPQGLQASTSWLLGEALAGQGYLPAARDAYQQAIRLWANLYRGADEPDEEVAHEWVAFCLSGLARVALSTGDRQEARFRLNQAMKIYRLTLGEDGLEAARTRALLALLDCQEGLVAQARVELTRVVEICRTRHFGAHSDTAEALYISGLVALEAGDMAAAAETLAAAEAELRDAELTKHPLMKSIHIAQARIIP